MALIVVKLTKLGNCACDYKIIPFHSVYQDDYEMVKDVDVSEDFVAEEETLELENVEANEVSFGEEQNFYHAFNSILFQTLTKYKFYIR